MNAEDKSPSLWWWLIPISLLLLWADHSRREDEAQAKERDRICDPHCRYLKEIARIDADAKRDLPPQEYQHMKEFERQMESTERAEEERRSHLTNDERELLEEAEARQYE